MLWLWILGAFILVVLLCRIRVGVLATVDGKTAVVTVTVGFLHVQLFPVRKKAEKRGKTPEGKKKRPGERKEENSDLLKPSVADILDAVQTLAPSLKRTLTRVRRGVRIKPFQMSLTLGGVGEPAKAAELYGKLHMAVWTAMPAVEQLLNLPDPHIHIGVDFETLETTVEGAVGLSIRIGTVLVMGLGIGVPALRWFLRYSKQKKAKKSLQTSSSIPKT